MSKGKIYTEETKPNYNGPFKTLGRILDTKVDKKFYLNGELEDWKYMKGAKKIERISRAGHKYIFSEGAIAFPDPLNRPSRTMLTANHQKIEVHILYKTHRLVSLGKLLLSKLSD